MHTRLPLCHPLQRTQPRPRSRLQTVALGRYRLPPVQIAGPWPDNARPRQRSAGEGSGLNPCTNKSSVAWKLPLIDLMDEHSLHRWPEQTLAVRLAMNSCLRTCLWPHCDSHMKETLRLALQGSVVKRALKYAVVVGLVLITINHSDAIIQGQVTRGRFFKMVLTVLVPYIVSTLSSVGAMRERRIALTRED